MGSGPETIKLIEYLLKVMPESLEIKSSSGLTPLSIAFSLHRYDAAKVLIAAGADQTTRDGNGANILHLLLCSHKNTCTDKKGLRKFLDLIDKRLVSSLLTERSSHHPGSLTPLARWMSFAGEDTKVLRIILDFAKPHNNEHLEMLAGSGDTPVHIAVKSRKQLWLNIMLEYRPDLLYRENSVGRTPYELAEDAYIATCVSDAPSTIRHSAVTSAIHRSNASFRKDYTPGQSIDTESVWRLCEKFMKENPGKRRLVSLMDANEVAKRLANRHANNVYGRSHVADDSDAGSDDGNDDNGDEVSKWY
jgi:ankyrin repeat protein